MADIKNIAEIQLATDQTRGERIRDKDKSLFFFGDRAQTKFGFSTDDTVEFSIYDTEDTLLHWEDKGLTVGISRGQAGLDSVILNPGDDLRRNGFSLGQYRIAYSFYNNALGSSGGNKVYIHAISPSRKEIRILPVKTGDQEIDGDFSLDFEDFSETLMLGEDFSNLTFNLVNNLPAFDDFGQAYQDLEATIFNLENEIARQRAQGGNVTILEFQLKAAQSRLGRIIGGISINEASFRNYYPQLTNAFNIHHEKYVKTTTVPSVLSPREREILLTGIVSEAVDMVLGLLYDYASPPENMVTYWKERLFNIANPTDEMIDDGFRFLKYVINFGTDETFLIVNWVRDDIEFPESPYSIVIKLLDPLPDEFEENDQLWISRELSPPVFEKVFLQGVEEEIEEGRELRPPNFNIDVDKMGRRSTPFESFEDLVSTHATTSQQLIDHFFSGSLEGACINVDYTDYANFVHFGSATERLENFKYKLEVIESYDSQITSLQNITGSASRSLNVLHDISRLETKKNNLIGGFDGYEKYLYNESGSQYSSSVAISESVIFHEIGEWPKQNKFAPFILYSVTASEAVTWFDTQEAIALRYDNENQSRLVNNTPSHITIDDSNSEYILFLEMVGQYFDVFHSYIKALGLLHNRDEDIFEGLSKDLTFNVVKSFGFDLENGNDYRELWEHAFGFDISGSLNQSGDLISSWINNDFETFETSSINPLDIASAINTAGNGNFRASGTVNLDHNVEYTVTFDLSGSLSGNNFFKISNNTNLNNAVFDQALVTGSNEFTITPTANWRGFYAGVRTTGTSTNYSITNVTFRPTEGNIQSMPTTDVTKEIWRRILTNLPYLLKTKGTARSIKALITCYGIPQSLLAIREYGGPDPSQFPRLQDRSSFVFEDFIYSIDLKGGQTVRTDWQDFGSYAQKPRTVELTFKTDQFSIATQSLVNVSNNWGLSLRQTGSLFGQPQGMIVFEIDGKEISSSVFDFYNDEFYTVAVVTDTTAADYTHSLFVKKADGIRITYQSSASLLATGTAGVNWEAGTDIELGSGSAFGSFFSGSMKEFRLFQPALDEDIIDNHVRWPQSYNSSEATSSFDDLVLRYSFDDPKNHNVDSTVDDVKIDQSFTNDGTAAGFEDGVNYTPTTLEFAALSTNFAGNRFISNKVRIEDNSLVFGNLNTTQRMEVSSFDFAPLDSNRLGIYFSPIDTINKDILATFGGVDISGVLGQPSDVFEQTYTGLKALNDYYFQKFTSPLDYNAFIRFLKRYDLTLFQQLKSLLPARTDATVGVLIEPHLLERHKEVTLLPMDAPETLEKSASIDGVIDREHTADQPVLDSGNIHVTESAQFSADRLEKETELEVTTGDSADYGVGNDWQNQGVIAVVEPIENFDPLWLCRNRDALGSQKVKYRGVVNTKETSFEQQEVIQTFFTNPNIIKATDEGPSKLRVE